MIKKIGKITAYIILGFIVLLILLLIMIGSGSLNNWLAKQVSKQGSKTLNAELKLEAIEGNLFSDFALKNLTLEKDSIQLFSMEAFKVDYSIFMLIKKQVQINSIQLENINVYAKQEIDSLWNLQKLLPPDTTVTKKEEPSEPLDWKVNIPLIEINRFYAKVEPLDTTALIPKTIDTGLSMSFMMDGDTIAAKIQQLGLHTDSPEFHLNDFTVDFSKIHSVLKWENMKVELPHTQLISKGAVNPDKLNLMDAVFKIDTLAFDDFRKMIPDLPVYGNPSISIEFKGSGQNEPALLAG